MSINYGHSRSQSCAAALQIEPNATHLLPIQTLKKSIVHIKTVFVNNKNSVDPLRSDHRHEDKLICAQFECVQEKCLHTQNLTSSRLTSDPTTNL